MQTGVSQSARTYGILQSQGCTDLKARLTRVWIDPGQKIPDTALMRPFRYATRAVLKTVVPIRCVLAQRIGQRIGGRIASGLRFLSTHRAPHRCATRCALRVGAAKRLPASMSEGLRLLRPPYGAGGIPVYSRGPEEGTLFVGEGLRVP
eukprot:2035026-Pyramimonas_sp.AAC.1